MTKTLRLMLLAIVSMVCGTVANAANTVTWQAASATALPNAIGEDISLTWAEGGGDQAPKLSSGYVYFYNGNRLTVAAASGKVITKVVFTFSGERYSMVTCDASGKNESSTGISNSYSDMTSTWTGEASSLIFRAPKQTGARNITSITVTYKNEGEVIETKADLSITGSTVNTTADLNQNPTVLVNYKNQGDAATVNAKAMLYVDGSENNSVEIGAIAAGATGWKQISYDKTTIEPGEHQVYITLTADNDGTAGVKQTEPVTVTFTKAAPQATFTVTAENVNVTYDATEYTVVAQVTNTSEVDATGVDVKLVNGMNELASTTVDVPAGQTIAANLTVSGGPFAAGQHEYQVLANGGKVGCYVKVTVEETPVQEVKDLKVVEIAGSIKLAETTNTVRVTVENAGTVNITDAPVTLKADENVLGTSTVSAVAGGQGFCQITVNTTGLTAGELAVTATVTVEDDANPDDNTLTTTLTVEAAPAPEATFELTAENVEVEFGAENITATVNVKNTSEVDADDVAVNLWHNGVIATENTGAIAAGESKNVTFTFANPFTTAGTYEVQALTADNKYGCRFNINVKEAPVTPVYDLAITEVLGTIKLGEDANTIRVTVKNNGNQDITDAPVTLKVGDNTIGTATVSAAAGEQNFVQVSVSKEGLEEGTISVVTTVEVANDATPEDNTATTEIAVEAAPVAQPEFSVTAQNVNVEFGTTSFDIVAVVKNTSEVDATDVAVKLLKGITEVETKTIAALAAGAETTVTFTVTEIGNAGTTASYYVQVGNAQADVTVTFENEPVAEVKDLAITNVSGTIYLNVDNNYVMVWVENLGNVDIDNAAVTLTTGETVLGTATVSATAGNTGFCSVTVSTEGLEVGQLDVVAKVEVEGDADLTNNEKAATIEVTTTTGIASVDNSAISQSDNCVYDLQGRRVSNSKWSNGQMHKGQLYIINGKKVILK